MTIVDLSSNLQTLQAALEVGERSAISSAVRSLRGEASLPTEALAPLQTLLMQPRLSSWMRRQAVLMLLRIAPTPPELLRILLDASDDEEEGWLQEIAQTILRRQIATFSLLTSVFADPTASLPSLRMAARIVAEAASSVRSTSLEPFRAAEDPLFSALSPLLSHPDLRLSRLVAWAFSVWPPPLPAVAIPALLPSLKHFDPQVASFVSEALASYTTLPQIAYPALLQALSYPYFAIRGFAALCLPTLPEPHPDETLPLLLGMLRASEAWERRCALEAIGRLGAAQSDCIPRIAEPLSDPDDDVCIAAAEALRRLGHRALVVLPALLAALEHPSWRRRRVLYHTIGQIGPDASEALPAFLRGLTEDRWRVRRVVVQALAELRPSAADAEEALLRAFSDTHWEIREAVAEALTYLRDPSSAVVSALHRGFSDPKPPVRAASIRALGWLPSLASHALPTLALALASSEPALRLAAAESLHRFGPLAEPLASDLQACLASETSPHIRSLCQQTLLRFS